mgnify:CR=1 FL=1
MKTEESKIDKENIFKSTLTSLSKLLSIFTYGV